MSTKTRKREAARPQKAVLKAKERGIPTQMRPCPGCGREVLRTRGIHFCAQCASRNEQADATGSYAPRGRLVLSSGGGHPFDQEDF